MNKPKRQKQPPAIKAINNPKTPPLKLLELPQLTSIRQAFKREIDHPYEFYSSIYQQKTPQRCIIHNNVQTLYCVNDRKPLCVTCMYQSNVHRKHKVIPLNRAIVELEEDLKGNLKCVQRELDMIQFLKKKSFNKLERMQHEFPEILEKMVKFYDNLQKMIDDKRVEHFHHIKQTWQKHRYEFNLYAKQFSNIQIYIIQSLKGISERISEQNIVFNRNISTVLTKFSKIISADSLPQREVTYLAEIGRFMEIQKLIKHKLAFGQTFQLQKSNSRTGLMRNVKMNKSSVSKSKSIDKSNKSLNKTFQNKNKPPLKSNSPIHPKQLQSKQKRVLSSNSKVKQKMDMNRSFNRDTSDNKERKITFRQRSPLKNQKVSSFGKDIKN